MKIKWNVTTLLMIYILGTFSLPLLLAFSHFGLAQKIGTLIFGLLIVTMGVLIIYDKKK